MMIESFDMTMISAEPVPASAGSDMMNCRLTSGNNELKVHTVRYLRGRSTQNFHSAASLSAPPQLDPWPAVHP
jgi:hypothetical protein